MGPDAEQELKSRVRADLPPDAFRRRPLRLLLALPILGTIVAASTLVAIPVPVYVLPLLYAVLSNAYVTFMFFGHEVAHGAVVASRPLQTTLLFFSCAVFVVSPHLWRHWHNRAHHAHPNVPGIDPDRYDRLEDLDRTWAVVRWLTTRIAPGSGHWLSAAYLFVAFTVHGQVVLWLYSRRQAWPELHWWRAVAETILIAGFWAALGVWLEVRGALLVIVLPMLLANAVVMAYVATNHMLRPLSERAATLSTTLSLSSPRWLDAIHLHFSHHVEHHLFPTLSHRYYPLVRASLRRRAGTRYFAPTHWGALRVLYATPRHYAENNVLVNPLTGTRVAMAEVEARLRRADPLCLGTPTDHRRS